MVKGAKYSWLTVSGSTELRRWLALVPALGLLGACGEDPAATSSEAVQSATAAPVQDQPAQMPGAAQAIDQGTSEGAPAGGAGQQASEVGQPEDGGGAGLGAQAPGVPMAAGQGEQDPVEMPAEMAAGVEGEPAGEADPVASEPTEVPISVEFPGKLDDDWCTDQADNFSFFVTSMDALWALSDSVPGDLMGGFGGDLGGVEGADAICQTIAKATGHGSQTWRAFLSATDDGAGNPVHAIERIGEGPWHDAQGRMIAEDLAGLTAGDRPAGDPEAVADLVDECGIPLTAIGDAHDIITGSDKQGRLSGTDPGTTCNDWTSTTATLMEESGPFGEGGVMCGHSFPRMLPDFLVGAVPAGTSWVSDHGLRGCGKGANLVQDGAGSGTCVGCAGGYGGLYCFAE